MAPSGHVYTPEKTRHYEQRIREVTAIAMAGRSATKSAVIVHVAAIFEPPPSATRTRRAAILKNGTHAIKPDIDNVVKAALDGICFENGAICDDKQIIELCAFKQYGESACLMIDVFEVESAVDRFSNRWRTWESGDVAVSPI
jgi:Holliday junction resolvase RusA-like endonuclease